MMGSFGISLLRASWGVGGELGFPGGVIVDWNGMFDGMKIFIIIGMEVMKWV